MPKLLKFLAKKHLNLRKWRQLISLVLPSESLVHPKILSTSLLSEQDLQNIYVHLICWRRGILRKNTANKIERVQGSNNLRRTTFQIKPSSRETTLTSEEGANAKRKASSLRRLGKPSGAGSSLGNLITLLTNSASKQMLSLSSK